VRSPEGAVLTHLGRATTDEQVEAGGKWLFYKGFHKTLELYNLDNVLNDPAAQEQVGRAGIIVTEGPMDVAKLVELGCRNCVACFGAELSDAQADRLVALCTAKGVGVVLWFDRDRAGFEGAARGRELLHGKGIDVTVFDWMRAPVSNLTDAGELTPEDWRMLLESLYGHDLRL